MTHEIFIRIFLFLFHQRMCTFLVHFSWFKWMDFICSGCLGSSQWPQNAQSAKIGCFLRGKITLTIVKSSKTPMLKTVALNTVIVILKWGYWNVYFCLKTLQNVGDILLSSQDLMTMAFMSKKHVIINNFGIFCYFPIQFISVAFSLGLSA